MKEFTEYQSLFFKRIGIEPKEIKSIDDVKQAMYQFSKSIPFENLDVISRTYKEPISKELLKKQILINNEGGLCYKLNGCWYYFLKECGFESFMSRGFVLISESLDGNKKEWSVYSTHIIPFIKLDNQLYNVDVAFGTIIPFVPIPILEDNDENGIINTTTGIFKVKKLENQINSFHFDFVFQYRNYKCEIENNDQNKWVTGYTFNINKESRLINDEDVDFALTDIQRLIVFEKNGVFNQRLLATKIIDNTTTTLSDCSLTITNNQTGDKTKTSFNDVTTFNSYLKSVYNLPPISPEVYLKQLEIQKQQ